MTKIKLFGTINKSGYVNVDENTTIIELLEKYGDGMANDKKLEIVQIGGPTGLLLSGDELLNPLSTYLNNIGMLTVMFIDDKFCPVDFTKFFLKYVTIEMNIDDNDLKILSELIEEISSGNTRKYTYDELLNEVKEISQLGIVSKVKRNINYLLKHYESIFLEHALEKKCFAGICYRLFTAQCVNACPAEIDIPGYTALMLEGKNKEAYELMRQNNPLSLICGKICARPCEDRCRRGEIEHTVGVRALKHYAATVALDNTKYEETKLTSNKKRIGIIGTGPAGLSAAYFLAKTGYEVEMYEKHPVIGGMLAVGVPSYRLTQSSIDKEVELIEKLGVKIHKNTEIGRDISFKKVQNKQDAVILATGCHIPNMFSRELNNIEAAIDFLKDVKLSGRTSIGKDVIVIGGGDVAMDAARTALRLGANKVNIVSLESYLQMPANDEEKYEAKKEGINIINSYGTKDIHQTNNTATSITFNKCTKLYDINNKFNPLCDINDVLTLTCDHIILAIGQRSDLNYLGNIINIDSRGEIHTIDKYRTNVENVFVCGDMIAPGSAIKAVAEGKDTAKLIDNYFGGKGLYIGETIDIPVEQSHYSIWDTEGQTEKTNLFHSCIENAFDETRSIFTEKEAKLESLRCMRCDRNSRR